jgi:UDP-N-acetylglucosamine:LPS N-acetylglucosamine transferase
MLANKRILILTSKTGGGHISLAEALRDLIEGSGQAGSNKDAQEHKNISLLDPQPGFFHAHYRLVSRYALWLWAAEFQFFDTPWRALMAHRIFTRLVRRNLHALLDRLQPDLILTTYPFLSYEVMRVLEQCGSRTPLASLFSDANGVHAAWLTERRAAATLAPTRETYEQALEVGFPPERLHLVGWPVRAQFSRAFRLPKEAHAERLAQLNLVPDSFTVFLQGGGEGAAHADRSVESLLSLRALNVQVILAAGSNRALLERYKGASNLAALPYTRDIAPYMAAADIIMGKAGPNMLMEAVALGKPFIATAYIPGQEQANLPFIERHGLGRIALKPDKQRQLLTSLIREPDRLNAVSETVNAYRRWNEEANERIMPILNALMHMN